MRFEDAVASTVPLANAYRPGLQALREEDRGRINCSQPRRLKGSVNLDTALARIAPDDSRWDYGIGWTDSQSEVAIWIEVHSADSHHVSEVFRKAAWLKKWLKANSASLFGMTRREDGLVWLSTGPISLQRGSRQARQLALAGVSFPRKMLVLT
jgi:hypothetical protein